MKQKTILITLTVALLIVNGLLVYQNLSLQANLNELAPPKIEAGNTLKDFAAKDLSGNPVQISYNDENKKTVLLYFQTQCGYCKKQMPYWNKLMAGIDKSKFNVAAVTAETDIAAIEKYLNNFEADAWKVLSIKSEDAKTAKLTGTPTTVVINNKGVVEKVWVGMWLNKDVSDAGQYFGLDFTPDIALQQ